MKKNGFWRARGVEREKVVMGMWCGVERDKVAIGIWKTKWVNGYEWSFRERGGFKDGYGYGQEGGHVHGMGWSVAMEENIGIYRRYIVYREESTRYFMEKNRRRDISINITKISAIYWFGEIYRRFFQKISSGGKKSVIYRRYIADFFVIFPLLHATWSDGPDHARVDPTA